MYKLSWDPYMHSTQNEYNTACRCQHSDFTIAFFCARSGFIRILFSSSVHGAYLIPDRARCVQFYTGSTDSPKYDTRAPNGHGVSFLSCLCLCMMLVQRLGESVWSVHLDKDYSRPSIRLSDGCHGAQNRYVRCSLFRSRIDVKFLFRFFLGHDNRM